MKGDANAETIHHRTTAKSRLSQSARSAEIMFSGVRGVGIINCLYYSQDFGLSSILSFTI